MWNHICQIHIMCVCIPETMVNNKLIKQFFYFNITFRNLHPAHIHQFKKLFWAENSVFNAGFKGFGYTNIIRFCMTILSNMHWRLIILLHLTQIYNWKWVQIEFPKPNLIVKYILPIKCNTWQMVDKYHGFCVVPETN